VISTRHHQAATTSLLPGFALVAAVTVVATFAGNVVPLVGAPVVAIVAGMAISVVRPPTAAMRPGITVVSKRLLQASIVVLGTGLSLRQVLRTGEGSLPVLIGTLVIALAAAWLVGRRLHIHTDLNVLIGVGTAICGASAIAAADAVLEADEADVSYAVATIFTFNVVAVVTFPAIGHAIGLSQHAFGLWAGTAVNDTSSVVAASTIYGHTATTYGVVVKLTRTLAIIPVCLALAVWRQRHPTRPSHPTADSVAATAVVWRRVVPMFILGFVGAVTLNTLGFVPAAWHHGLSTLATWMITAALGAIGLSTRLRDIRRAGTRPIALGAILWVTVGLTSLGLQRLSGAM
jgi:uncharacterized integral membrane protein (TIGR00698 family)